MSRPKKRAASVGDLRQMYTYCRFWDAKKALLLYPGDPLENEFQNYLTDDYSLDHNDEKNRIKHECKMGFTSVLDEHGNLDDSIGEQILDMLNLNNNS